MVISEDETINNTTTSSKSQSPDGLSIFCREVRNLLRSKPNCMVPFSKFVPAYHNHYGRQCCVYQFGYTKLIELLESIPHVVQIIGDGTNRYITLTHREQIKRFASDLIKVVKSQPGKKLKLSQFARAYEQVLGRIFRVEDYGTNNINVLLAEIWEGTINIMPIKREFVDGSLIRGPLFVNSNLNNKISSNLSSNNNNNDGLDNSSISALVLNKLVESTNHCEPVNKPYITEQYPDAWFEIPRRERSDKEIKRTKYFIWDVIELLSNFGPDYSVTFSKFIPSYHYYFNRQCKVSIFGFSKLIDLFESISPEVVEIVDQGSGEEKLIKLAEQHWPINKQTRTNNTNSNSNKSQHHHRSRHLSHHHHHHHHNHNQQARSGSNNNTKNNNNNNNRSRGHSEETSEEDKCSEIEDYEEEDVVGDDVILPPQAIDDGPTEEELMELEAELEAYEAMQSKRSSRMAALLGIL